MCTLLSSKMPVIACTHILYEVIKFTMIYFAPFSNIITISLPGFLSVQSAPVGPVDVQQGWLQKCYDPRERGPHSFYLLRQYICLRDIERWLDWLCVHVILWVFSFFLSLERITLRHAAAKSFYAPSPRKQWRWNALSDRQELTAQSKQWRYCVPRSSCSLRYHQPLWLLQRQGKSVFINLRVSSVLSVYLPQLTLCWSKWFW